MDRAPKGPALAAPLDFGQPVGSAVEVLVLPAVITGHALNIGAVDHDTLGRQCRFDLSDDSLESGGLTDGEIRRCVEAELNIENQEARRGR